MNILKNGMKTESSTKIDYPNYTFGKEWMVDLLNELNI